MSLNIHRRIVSAVKDLASRSSHPALDVIDIAVKAKVDTRTAKLHLRLLEHYGFGQFADKGCKCFMTDDQKLWKLKGEPVKGTPK